MIAVAVTAMDFGQRPSALMRISDPVTALDFDCAARLRLLELRDGRKVERVYL